MIQKKSGLEAKDKKGKVISVCVNKQAMGGGGRRTKGLRLYYQFKDSLDDTRPSVKNPKSSQTKNYA